MLLALVSVVVTVIAGGGVAFECTGVVVVVVVAEAKVVVEGVTGLTGISVAGGAVALVLFVVVVVMVVVEVVVMVVVEVVVVVVSGNCASSCLIRAVSWVGDGGLGVVGVGGGMRNEGLNISVSSGSVSLLSSVCLVMYDQSRSLS